MATRVTDNPAESRFEIFDDDQRAGFTTYREDGDEITFVHTEIDPAFEGRGLGGTLAREALDTARRRHLSVLPVCPFIRGWISKHPDYVDLVPESRRAEFGL